MASEETQQEAGGFFVPSLPSPPLSAPSTSASILPRPRATTLKAGSPKENAVRNYVDNKLLEISGRYERRFEAGEVVSESSHPGATVAGYRSFADLARDLDAVIDIIWVSGTPSLQIPFLFNIALAVTDYMTSFDFAPKATLQLLQKLDCAFSSLLRGQDACSGDPLPGLESGRRITTTEKIRLQGLVARTRVQIVDVARGGRAEEESSTDVARRKRAEEDSDTDFESTTMAEESDDGGHDRHLNGRDEVDLDIARVYEKTLADLSDSLDPSFG